MRSYTELEKISRKGDRTGLPVVRLSVLGDCATQHLCRAISGLGLEEGLAFEVWEADYDQIELQIVDGDSPLYESRPDFVFFMLCHQKLYEAFCRTPENERPQFAEQTMERLTGYWETVVAHCGARILQSNFMLVDDAVFGSYANKTAYSYVYQVRKLNLLLMQAVQENAAGKRVSIIDMDLIQQRYGEEVVQDNRTYFVGKLPVAVKYLPAMAEQTVSIIKTLRGSVKKCVVTDLDNTLWGGVIGDDGVENIQIGELGQGQAFSALQVWLNELKKRGVLLAVCSKNEEAAARLPFEKHPEMILALDDFAMFVANWEDKAGNIRRIQETLNIGMDSIVFLDDNPFERELVRSLIPDICVPELPGDPSEYLPYLRQSHLFETASFSEEDAKRTGQYREEALRATEQKRFADYGEYLESLHMEAYVSPFDIFHTPRIAQLSQRSNQFNLRTIRYTEADVERLSNDARYATLFFCLKDRFGDHGLISVVVLKKQPERALFIEEWFMSCRVLKRGMEEFIADTIVKKAREFGFARVIGEYLPTPKNQMVERLYERLGFIDLGGGHYEADVQTYRMHETAIQITGKM
ncbi:MAG: HAD-IIIC family phosphatase [bacterium]|nr:HAD-IIIC family phosphatase [bacterium]